MKVGILGCGKMGGHVAKELKKCPQVSSIAAYDIDESRIREVRDELRIAGTTKLSDILSDPDVKLVFITAANHAHRELAVKSLESGKAVLCEKPIANTLDDALEMVKTAERLNQFLQIGFELRYSHLYTKVKDWIDAGLIGDVVSTHCLYCSSAYPKKEWRNTNLEGGNTFGERLSHYVDLTRWWVGSPVTEVFTACAPNVVSYTEGHDNYHTTYKFKNGAVSHISYYMNYPALFRGDPLADNVTDLQLGDGHKLRFIVVGTKGAAETDVFYRRIKRWEFVDTPEIMASDWIENLTWEPRDDHFYYHNTSDQIRDVVRRVAENLPPMTPARDAYETMKLCFAAEKSADSGLITRLDEISC